ncbi:helix-turn-helix domain-containing protein [Halonotius pteroides]
MSVIESTSEPPASPPDSRHSTEPHTTESIDAECFLEVISDTYAQQILLALVDCPTAAATLAEELDASRPTVYRRLNSLESVGLIKSTVALDADGHHRKQFHVVVDSANLTFDSSGIKVTALS